MQRLNLGAGDLAELAAEILERGGCLSFRATGSSMQPTLRDGDLLKVVPVELSSLGPGDVVLYRAPDGCAAVHRVGETHSGSLMLSCDSRPGVRYEIRIGQVLGVVVSALRGSQPVLLDYSPARRLHFSFCRMLRLARSAFGRSVFGCLTTVTSFRPVRRCFRGILKPMVRYFVTPSEQSSAVTVDQCTWDLVQASIGRMVIGSAQLVRFTPGSPFSGYQWLFSMRVNPLFRGGGIGRRLAELAVERASFSGVGNLCLIVAGDNRRAKDLYRSLGFRDLELSELDEEIVETIGPDRTVMTIQFPDE
jgi:GNAT superfamily N-acetyltransferase